MKNTEKKRRRRFPGKKKRFIGYGYVWAKIREGKPLNRHEYNKVFQKGLLSDDEIGNIFSLFGAEEIANATSEILEITQVASYRLIAL